MENLNLLDFFNEKKKNFIELLKQISDEKNALNNIEEKMENNFMSLLFLMRLKDENKQENINDFMEKMKIKDEHRYLIEKYFDCFIDIKNQYMNKKITI